MRRRIRVSTPPPIVARHLGVSLETPLLMVVLTLRDSAGEAVEWVRLFGHPDRPWRDEVLDVHTGLWSTAAD